MLNAFVCLRLHQTTLRIVGCQTFVHRRFGWRRRRGMRHGMSWEESMFAVFDDLEQQAEGLHLVERDAEVADLTMAEYSRISLGARLHASLGRDLRVRLVGGHRRGRPAGPARRGLAAAGRPVRGVDRAPRRHRHASPGSPPRADSEETWSVVDRLTPARACCAGCRGGQRAVPGALLSTTSRSRAASAGSAGTSSSSTSGEGAGPRRAGGPAWPRSRRSRGAG